MWFLHLRMWNQQLQRADYRFCPFSFHSSDYVISISLFFLLTVQISWANSVNFNLSYCTFQLHNFHLVICYTCWHSLFGETLSSFFFFNFYNMLLYNGYLQALKGKFCCPLFFSVYGQQFLVYFYVSSFLCSWKSDSFNNISLQTWISVCLLPHLLWYSYRLLVYLFDH